MPHRKYNKVRPIRLPEGLHSFDPECPWCMKTLKYPGYVQPGELPPCFNSSIGWPRAFIYPLKPPPIDQW